MPQINEYLPESNAQGAVGGVTPNLEAVSLFGRGIEHVGAGLEEVGNVIHKRQAQSEISQVYGQFAQARADWNIKLKEQLKDGSLDPDKFDQDYADYVNKAGDGIQTAEGKDFFNRQANRLGGTLMQNAMIGKAKIAGEQAYADISQGINVHVANLMSHPSDVSEAIDATQELIAAKQKDGTLSPEQAIAAKRQLLPQLAEAAMKGHAEEDPGTDATGKPLPNIAKQLLDKGAFAEYLNEPQRAALYTYARQADERRRVDSDRAEITAHRNLEKQGLDFMDQASNRILNGQFSLKELQSAPLTFQQKEYLQAKVKAQNAQEVATDPRRFTNVYGKMLDGDITTRGQLIEEYHKGGLAPSTMDHLMHELDATPDGHIVKNMQKQYDKMAQELRFKGVGGVYTQAGDAAYLGFQTELNQARQLANSQNISDRAFFSNQNPKDPLSPVAILNKYRMSALDRARTGAEEAVSQANGQSSGVVKYSTSPTKELPPPTYGPERAPEVQPESAPSAPSPAPPKQKAKDWWEPHPEDSPEVAANRAKNAADRQKILDAVDSLKSSSIGTGLGASMKGIEESLDSLFKGKAKANINAPAIPAEDAIRPGESIGQWKKRTGK